MTTVVSQPERLGGLIRRTATIAPGDTVRIQLDSSTADGLTWQCVPPASGSAVVKGSLLDAADAAAFPLVGEDGEVSGVVGGFFPGQLRAIFVSADAGNTGDVTFVVVQ